jgi:signal peptidase I
VKVHPTSAKSLPVFDSERLLAFSGLLGMSSREFEFVLQGKSMRPILPDGSKIRVRLAADDQFMVGQVLTYVAKDRVVTHRLVRSVKSGSKSYLITRGDATVCCDWPVPATSVLGTVIGFSTDGFWQSVGPPPARSFGFRWLAFLISSLVAGILKVSPSASVWTAKRIIRINGMVERVLGYLRRRAALSSRAGAAL